MINLKRRYFALAGTLAAALGLALGAAGAAQAGSVACQASADCHSFNLPIHGGLDLDAINWGINPQTGTSYNDQVAVWGTATAGRAADYVLVPVTVATPGLPVGATGKFLIEFAPRDVPSGFCVSTVTDVAGAYAKLRPCALATTGVTPTAAGPNQWQTFTEVAQGDGFFQFDAFIESAPMCLNDKGWGGNGTPVVSWACAPAGTAPENQLWEAHG